MSAPRTKRSFRLGRSMTAVATKQTFATNGLFASGRLELTKKEIYSFSENHGLSLNKKPRALPWKRPPIVTAYCLVETGKISCGSAVSGTIVPGHCKYRR